MSSPQITLWGRRNSINVQKALWTLGERMAELKGGAAA